MMLHSRLWQSPRTPQTFPATSWSKYLCFAGHLSAYFRQCDIAPPSRALDALKQSYGVLAAVLNSDRARACKKVAKHFKCLATLAWIEVAPS
eukprot:6592449-Alexandrium_andersonii.AAC.1